MNRVTRRSSAKNKYQAYNEGADEYFEKHPLTEEQEEQYRNFKEREERVRRKTYDRERKKHTRRQLKNNNVGRFQNRNQWNKDHPIPTKYEWAQEKGIVTRKLREEKRYSRRPSQRIVPRTPAQTQEIVQDTTPSTEYRDRLVNILQRKTELRRRTLENETEQDKKIRRILDIENQIRDINQAGSSSVLLMKTKEERRKE